MKTYNSDRSLTVTVPQSLAATVKSCEADANAFPWQRINNQGRTLVSIFSIDVTVDDAGRGADSACDIAELDYSKRLLRPTFDLFRAENFTNTLLDVHGHLTSDNNK